MNIDPNSKPEQARQRVMKRQLQSWLDQIREHVKCPRCEVEPGEYCKDRHGRLMTILHARRHKLYLLTPSEIAPPSTETATLSSKSRRGFGRGVPEAQAQGLRKPR